ncbi:MAG: acyl-CoA reductase [Chitinophagaceae bacterium]|nr:acyl-CoA reductase [Chitinophagaceae bacterium]MDB5223863.1 acyl-CoA reductase [Chitinophagaceae bacterium]
MNLAERIDLMAVLGKYLQSNGEDWQIAKQKAFEKNGWFTPEFIDHSLKNIVTEFLQKDKLENWAKSYYLDDNINPKNVGIVMAGNIPLVGFHDFLSVFISGHKQTIKLSSKDNVLLKHITDKLFEWQPSLHNFIVFADMLKGCDAYIATGSNNTARYFDYYFGKYPNIIRRNRTSIAIIKGNETANDLELLADDVHLYFGLGCRNVTKIYVPEGYDFVPLLNAFKKYAYFSDHTKYRNNYDYNLALLIMNNVYYMTNESVLLVENEQLFSPISQLNYSFYTGISEVKQKLETDESVQCMVGDNIAFGEAQQPSLSSYADGIDTMQFLLSL